jgi:hypothetical protein
VRSDRGERSAVFKDAVICYDEKGHCFTVDIVVVMHPRGEGNHLRPASVKFETEWSYLHPMYTWARHIFIANSLAYLDDCMITPSHLRHHLLCEMSSDDSFNT